MSTDWRGDKLRTRINSNLTDQIFAPENVLPRSFVAIALLCTSIFSTAASVALADESESGFWLPGIYGSLAAVPGTPGWAVASVYYHTSVSAGADVAGFA